MADIDVPTITALFNKAYVLGSYYFDTLYASGRVEAMLLYRSFLH